MSVKIQRKNQRNGQWETIKSFKSWPKIGTKLVTKRFLWWTWTVLEDIEEKCEKDKSVEKLDRKSS